MTDTITKHSPRKIDNTLLAVDQEHPLETLPLISDALVFMGTFFVLNPSSSRNPRADAVAGVILDFLSAAIDDVQDALVNKYMKQNCDKELS